MSKTSILTVLLAVLLAWRSAVSATGFLRELDASNALESLRISREERFERTLGGDFELYRTLRDRTPQDARIFFLADRDAGAVAFSTMQVLLFPRRLFPLERIPPGWRPEGEDLDERVHLLEYGTRRELDGNSPWDPVAESGGFRLWRLRRGP